MVITSVGFGGRNLENQMGNVERNVKKKKTRSIQGGSFSKEEIKCKLASWRPGESVGVFNVLRMSE